MSRKKYTLVQHSNAGRDPEQFGRAVEPRSCTEGQAKKVEAAGGVLFNDYMSAEEATDAVNYPPTAESLIPEADGSFATRKSLVIDGSPLWLPPAAPVGL